MYNKPILCAATRVSNLVARHFSCGGSSPSFQDERMDVYDARLHYVGKQPSYERRIYTSYQRFYPHGDKLTQDAIRQDMLLRGYLQVYYRRSFETPKDTLVRRLSVYLDRRDAGLKTSLPRNPSKNRRSHKQDVAAMKAAKS